MTLTFQAVALSALIAMIFSLGNPSEDCVTRSSEAIGGLERAGAPTRYRITLENSCDRPLRVATVLSCPGQTQAVTRHLPASGQVSWSQTLPGEATACSFAASPAGW